MCMPRSSLVLLFAAAAASAVAQQPWITPTPEELSMTSIPEVPGASGVMLYREEGTDDHLRMFSYYVRLKVLKEGGKDYANVELPFAAGEAGARIDSIAGRTVQPDGSAVPFTGLVSAVRPLPPKGALLLAAEYAGQPHDHRQSRQGIEQHRVDADSAQGCGGEGEPAAPRFRVWLK